MNASYDTTVTSDGEGVQEARARKLAPVLPCLTLVWSAHEPHRVGECFFLTTSEPLFLGRGHDLIEAAFVGRHSPRSERPAARPLVGEKISRKQCELGRSDQNDVYVANIGKAPLLVNGALAKNKVKIPIRVGDVLTMPGFYSFLVGAREANVRMQGGYPTAHAFGEIDAFGIVGESAAIWRARDAIAHAARSSTHVLVIGETGTGKELASRAIHGLSDRAKRPYVSRNITALSAGIFDAEVWGCRANFPNAGNPEVVGFVGEARDGMLMLDEIGGLAPELQRKVLTFLDAGRYKRCGETHERVSLSLVIGATNAPERLLHDFAPRFKTTVRMPSLAERREDIPLLARHIALSIVAREGGERFVHEREGRRDVRMSCDFVTWLVRRDYVGNIRELEKIIRDAMFASAGDTIDLEDEITRDEPTAVAADVDDIERGLTRQSLIAALRACGENQTKAAVMLGVSRDRVKRAKKKFGI